MASIDAAWLGMEDPTNLMMVTGVMALDGKVELKRLRGGLDRRLRPFGRFHQRVVRPRSRGSLPHWEDDAHFDIDNHLSHVALPAPGGDDGLREMVSELMSAPLDSSKPLWHMHVIDDYRGGSVILTRVHHCVGGGSRRRPRAGAGDRPEQGAQPRTRGRTRHLPVGSNGGARAGPRDDLERQARPPKTRGVVGAGAARGLQGDRQGIRGHGQRCPRRRRLRRPAALYGEAGPAHLGDRD